MLSLTLTVFLNRITSFWLSVCVFGGGCRWWTILIYCTYFQHTHHTKPVACHQKLRLKRCVYTACSLLEPILEWGKTTWKVSPYPSTHTPILFSSAAVRRLDNFTGSYNHRCQPQMKMPSQMHFDSSQEEGDICRSLRFFLKDSCRLWISGLPESLWHKWKVITISEIKTLGSDTTFSITQKGC